MNFLLKTPILLAMFLTCVYADTLWGPLRISQPNDGNHDDNLHCLKPILARTPVNYLEVYLKISDEGKVDIHFEEDEDISPYFATRPPRDSDEIFPVKNPFLCQNFRCELANTYDFGSRKYIKSYWEFEKGFILFQKLELYLDTNRTDWILQTSIKKTFMSIGGEWTTHLCKLTQF